jgi:4-amino-4-deoxy-L-arabinose transferase-like glycosyltransferase
MDLETPRSHARWWREAEFVLVVLLVAGIYFSRATALPIRGEESRWARVACEMLETGDWLIPRQQWQAFPDRPPLGNWLMAATMWLTGDAGLLAVRLPTLLATLLTTVIIYGYSRTFLSPLGALAAGAAYATMGQVLQLGRVAESDSMLTLFTSASLLVWHAGYERRWPATATWVAGYTLAGLAGLTKSLQGPVYFAAAVGVFLLLRRDWRYLINWRHVVGIAAMLAVLAAWTVPLSTQVPWEFVRTAWGHQAAARFDYSQPGAVLAHLATYPLEVLGCLLPWSLLLVPYLNRQFRRSLGEARWHVTFLVTAIVVAFPTCWLAPTARGRYFMPLYPCFAPLVGLVIERAAAAARGVPPQRWWRTYQVSVIALMIAGAIGVLYLGFGGPARPEAAQPPVFALCFAVASAALAVVVWRGLDSQGRWRSAGAVLAIAAFLGLAHTGPVLNYVLRRSEDTAGAVAALKQDVLREEGLVSFGPVHHIFAYHYGQTIPRLPWPANEQQVRADSEYFCFSPDVQAGRELPFAWEQVAIVSCERFRQARPEQRMIVGRRLDAGQHTATRRQSGHTVE